VHTAPPPSRAKPAAPKPKRIGAWLGLLGAATAMALWLVLEPAPGSEIAEPPTISVQQDSQAAQPDGRFAALPERETLGNERGQLFSALRTAPAAAARAATAPAAKSPQPAAPPMPYRVAGKVWHNGVAEIVLARGDRVYYVGEGEDLGDGYRVEAISKDQVTLLYVPLALKQNLPVLSRLEGDAAPAPATAADRPHADEIEAHHQLKAPKALRLEVRPSLDETSRRLDLPKGSS
jgi:hypothetical protein